MIANTHSKRLAPRTLLGGVLLSMSVLPFAVGSQPAKQERSGKGSSEPLDLFTQHKDEYAATEELSLVDVGPARYLSITGRGEPGGEVFRKKTGILYGVAYSLNMKSRAAGRAYAISPLEGLWWGTKSKTEFLDEPRETWNWKLLIRTPEFIGEKDLAAVVGPMAKQGRGSGAGEVKLETVAEGRCVQVLHIGPYSEETKTIAAMRAFAKSKGLAANGPHHEIYLSDPNRVAPDKLRTILRQPVK